MNLKNFLKWLIRGWLPQEPKMRKNLLKERARLPIAIVISAATIALVSSFLLSTQPTILPLPPPMYTGEYDPGVSVGDYVTYGNFVCEEDHPVVFYGTVYMHADLAFWKVEIIKVKGKEVIFRQTQQYKNGSATPCNGRTVTWDVEQFDWSLGTENWIDWGLIMAANLTEGYPRAQNGSSCMLDKTEVRTYLGVSRNVNLVIISYSMDREPLSDDGEEPLNYTPPQTLTNVTEIWVYDQVSGFLLEYEQSLETLDGYVINALSIIETNIFSSPTLSTESSSLQEDTAQSIPTEALYATTGLVGIVIFGVTMVIFRKRRLKEGETIN